MERCILILESKAKLSVGAQRAGWLCCNTSSVGNTRRRDSVACSTGAGLGERLALPQTSWGLPGVQTGAAALQRMLVCVKVAEQRWENWSDFGEALLQPSDVVSIGFAGDLTAKPALECRQSPEPCMLSGLIQT